MTFHFGQLIAHVCKTRNARAGSIVGSGTVSNKDWARGYSCIAEKRAIETIEGGAPKTPFMQFGDTIRIEMKDATAQRLRRHRPGRRAPRAMSDELPRTLKTRPSGWCSARSSSWPPVAAGRAQKATLRRRRRLVEIGRGADGHYHWPGQINGHARRLPGRHRRHRHRDPDRARRRLGLGGEGEVQSSTAGGLVTGRVVRADLALQAACASTGCAWSRCRARGAAARHGRARPAALAATRRRAAHRPRRRASSSPAALARDRVPLAPRSPIAGRWLALLAPCAAGRRRRAPRRLPAGGHPARRRAPAGRHARAAATAAFSGASQGRPHARTSTARSTRPGPMDLPRPAPRRRSRRATCSRSSSTCSTPTSRRASSRRASARPDGAARGAGERLERHMAAACMTGALARFAPEIQIASLGVMAARRDGLDPAYAIDLVLASWRTTSASASSRWKRRRRRSRRCGRRRASDVELVTQRPGRARVGPRGAAARAHGAAWTDSDLASSRATSAGATASHRRRPRGISACSTTAIRRSPTRSTRCTRGGQRCSPRSAACT